MARGDRRSRRSPTPSSTASSTTLIGSSSRAIPCADAAPSRSPNQHEVPSPDRPQGSTGTPRAVRSPARVERARSRPGSPLWALGTIPTALTAHTVVMQLRHEPAALLPAPSSRSAAQRIEMITITGIGDHLRPEWPITFTGIRTDQAAVIPSVVGEGIAIALPQRAPRRRRRARRRSGRALCRRAARASCSAPCAGPERSMRSCAAACSAGSRRGARCCPASCRSSRASLGSSNDATPRNEAAGASLSHFRTDREDLS